MKYTKEQAERLKNKGMNGFTKHDRPLKNIVIKDGFYPVVRKDLLDIFDNEQNEVLKYSDIYTNFYDYIQSIESAVQKFESQPVAEWGKRAWIGFFQYLQSNLS